MREEAGDGDLWVQGLSWAGMESAASQGNEQPRNGVGRGGVVVTAKLCSRERGEKPLTLHGIFFLNAKSMGSIFTRKKLH